MDTTDIVLLVLFALMSLTIIVVGVGYFVIEYRLKRDRKRQLTPIIGVVLPRSSEDDA